MQRRVTIQNFSNFTIRQTVVNISKLMTNFKYLWSYITKKASCNLKHWTVSLLPPYASLGIWVISLSHKTTQENKKSGKNF